MIIDVKKNFFFTLLVVNPLVDILKSILVTVKSTLVIKSQLQLKINDLQVSNKHDPDLKPV